MLVNSSGNRNSYKLVIYCFQNAKMAKVVVYYCKHERQLHNNSIHWSALYSCVIWKWRAESVRCESLASHICIAHV